MCLDTFSSIPSKDSPIVPKQQGGGRAKIMGRKKKTKKNGQYTTASERRKRQGGKCIKKLFCPSPPHATTSARLAANGTNYWLVVGENSAWQQLRWWPGLCVNT